MRFAKCCVGPWSWSCKMACNTADVSIILMVRPWKLRWRPLPAARRYLPSRWIKFAECASLVKCIARRWFVGWRTWRALAMRWIYSVLIMSNRHPSLIYWPRAILPCSSNMPVLPCATMNPSSPWRLPRRCDHACNRLRCAGAWTTRWCWDSCALAWLMRR